MADTVLLVDFENVGKIDLGAIPSKAAADTDLARA